MPGWLLWTLVGLGTWCAVSVPVAFLLAGLFGRPRIESLPTRGRVFRPGSRPHVPTLRAPQGIATGTVRYSARMGRSATCVWRVDAELILALDEHLGPPVDSYVNGSQTWITDDGPADEGLEWRWITTIRPIAAAAPS